MLSKQIEIRGSILDTIPDTKSGAEQRSLDKVELKSIRLRTRILSQFQDHLLKKDQFVDDLFNHHHLPDQPGTRISCSLFVETDQPGFFKVNVSSQITR